MTTIAETLIQQGYQQAFQEAYQEAVQQGIQQAHHNSILELLEIRLGVMRRFSQRIYQIKDEELLTTLLKSAVLVDSLDAFEAELNKLSLSSLESNS